MRWYHANCCQSAGLRKRYNSPEDILTVPLLKGGETGLIGTAQLAFAAARVIDKGKAKPTITTDQWMKALEKELGCGVNAFLDGNGQGALKLLTEGLKCPRCDQA